MSETKTDTKVNGASSRRKYDEAFKREAVELWLRSGKSAGEVASELDLEAQQLYQWKRDLAERAGPAAPQDLEAEVVALRRENALLRQQRDILKKTLGILSEAPSNATNASTR